MESIITAMTTGVGTIVSNVEDMIAGILPAALPVLGLSIAVMFGLKFIKKVTKG